MWIAVGVILLAGGAGTGCHHRSRGLAGAAAGQTDSLVGVVSVTGTSFEQRLVLHTPSDVRALAASSADSAALVLLGGMEIVVRGSEEGAAFRVVTFEALRSGGAPVVDGVVVRDGKEIALRTQRGRVPLGNPPVVFDSIVGARVWVSGPVDTGPNTFGLITPP